MVRDADARGPFARPPEGMAVRFLRLPGVAGPTAKRNLGWRAADAPLVAFTDDDCRPAPGWLDALLAAARRAGLVPAGPDRPRPRRAPTPARAGAQRRRPGAHRLVRDLQHGLPAGPARAPRRLRRGLRRSAARTPTSPGGRSSQAPRRGSSRGRWYGTRSARARSRGRSPRRRAGATCPPWSRATRASTTPFTAATSGTASTWRWRSRSPGCRSPGEPRRSRLWRRSPTSSARLNWREPHPRRLARGLATLPVFAAVDAVEVASRLPAAIRHRVARALVCGSRSAPDVLAGGPPRLRAPRP